MLVTAGLGDNSYVLASGGEALVVDPQRDVNRYLDAARSRGAEITTVLETHVHNDYVSGAVELRDATGAEIVGPAAAGYRFPHRGVIEGDQIVVGKLHLTVLETPGHTPEHVSYLLYEEGADAPAAVFTGGSLMVGGAGRTDLVSEQHTGWLTRDQYRTLRRLATLPDEIQILPTHGAGSFCGAAPGRKERTSTMGEERRLNAALAAPDEESFVHQQLTGLLAYPIYYRHMAPINRAGPRVLRGSFGDPPGLSADEFERRVEAGAWAVDGRWRVQFARAHVPGSINVELADSFGSYVGWVVPFGEPLVLVLPEPEEDSLAEAVAQLVRIGYERVEGYLAGGVEAWRDAGRPLRSYPVAGLEELCRTYRSGRPPQVLDVRQRTEWDAGHIDGSRHVFV